MDSVTKGAAGWLYAYDRRSGHKHITSLQLKFTQTLNHPRVTEILNIGHFRLQQLRLTAIHYHVRVILPKRSIKFSNEIQLHTEILSFVAKFNPLSDINIEITMQWT